MVYLGGDNLGSARVLFSVTARRVNLPPVAVVSPERQELTLPLTSALIDGSRGYPAILQGVLPSAL